MTKLSIGWPTPLQNCTGVSKMRRSARSRHVWTNGAAWLLLSKHEGLELTLNGPTTLLRRSFFMPHFPQRGAILSGILTKSFRNLNDRNKGEATTYEILVVITSLLR